jgi:16S rRNA (guanine966-N2)-methyltransferase
MARRKQKNGSPAGRLRIVAGNWRSRLLDVAAVEGLRPTSERVRETLFNWLAPGIAGARCLDLFAGTGALGLEALSRGAASVTFVENHPQAIRQLRRNIEVLGAANAELVPADAIEFLQGGAVGLFDIVFLDPPFARDLLGETCRLLVDARCLAPRAVVYLEDRRERHEPELPTGWCILKSKAAGNVRYMLAQPKGSD